MAGPKLAVVADNALTRPAPTRRAVISPSRIDTFNSHPAVGLTADALVSYYRQAERGSPVRQFDTFDDIIENDGHLRGLYTGRIETVAGCDWVLKPGRPDKASELAAAELEERLRNEIGFREFIAHHLTAPHYGFACTNLVWDLEDGIVSPVEFINAAHRRFAAPSEARAGEIWLVDGEASQRLIELERGLWAISRARGRNPYAAGTMRTCAWWAMFKRWGVRDWQVFAEMFGLPLAIGYYEEGASLDSRNALEAALKTIGEDGYAILSSLTELVIKDTARSGDSSTVYPHIVKTSEEQMSKLLTGGTLNTDVAGVGSYNAAAVHESRGYMLTRSDARSIEEMFVRDVGLPFKVWNGFDRAAPPRLKIQITRDNLERAQVLELIGQAVELDEDQIREEFSLRTPAPGKGVKFPGKAAPAGNKPPGNKPPGGGKPSE